jgi:hypothetical protein
MWILQICGTFISTAVMNGQLFGLFSVHCGSVVEIFGGIFGKQLILVFVVFNRVKLCGKENKQLIGLSLHFSSLKLSAPCKLSVQI